MASDDDVCELLCRRCVLGQDAMSLEVLGMQGNGIAFQARVPALEHCRPANQPGL